MRMRTQLMSVGGLALSVGSVVAGSAITSGAVGPDATPAPIVQAGIVAPAPDGEGMVACTYDDLPLPDLPLPDLPAAGAPGNAGTSIIVGGDTTISEVADAAAGGAGVVTDEAGSPRIVVHSTGIGPAGELPTEAVPVPPEHGAISLGEDGVMSIDATDVREGTEDECAALRESAFFPPIPGG